MSKRRQEGDHQSKETYDAMQNGFQFSAGGGPSDIVEPAQQASQATLAKRKFAPLKKKFGNKTLGGGGGGGSSIPNVFAGLGNGVTFGAGINGASANGSAPQASQQSPGFPGFGSPAPSPGFGQSNGSFNFGQQPQQPEAAKPNPFAGVAPTQSAPQSNGFSFSQSSPNSSFQSAPTNGTGFGFGDNSNSAPSVPTQTPGFGGVFGGQNSAPPTPAPESAFNKTPDFSFSASSNGTSMFGGNANTASNPPGTAFTFGSTSNNDNKSPSFSGFGQTPATTAPSSTSGFSFGSSTPVTATPTSPFTFGSNATNTKKDEAPKPAFSLFGNPPATEKKAEEVASQFGSFGSPAPEGKKEPTKPAPLGGFGASAPEPPKPVFSFSSPAAASPSSGSLFGKPVDANATANSGFGFGSPKPTPSPEPTVSPTLSGSLFGKPPSEEKLVSGIFAKPPEEQKKVAFGGFSTSEKKDEASKFSFGSSADKKEDSPKTLFGTPVAEKKQEPPKNLFGSAPATPTGPSNSGSLFSSPSKPAVSGSLFGQPAENKAAPSPPGFGSPAKSPGSPQPTASNAVSFPGFSAPKESSPTNSFSPLTSGMRSRSPPLPPDVSQWSTAQLTEYYNLFALRSLNHAFKEQLTKVDIFADLSELCQVYQNEAAKIRDLMSKNQRYKFDDTKSGAPGKRAGDDITEGGGKRSKTGAEDNKSSSTSRLLESAIGSNKGESSKSLASKPKFEFKPPTSSSPAASGGLALPKTPSFGFTPPTAMSVDKTDVNSPGSVLDDTASSSGSNGWVNPFAKADTKDMSDDADSDDNDDSGKKKAPVKTGGLFDRVQTPPKPSGLFSSGGNQTWSPDKGFKFAPAPAESPFSASGSSLFGNPTSALASAGSVGLFSNGTPSKPQGSIAMPSSAALSAPATPSASEAEGEPSDATPPPEAGTDLSMQGPGEEEEDATFHTRAIVYETVSGKFTKKGLGMLRVLKNRENGKARIIVRTDGGKVLMNVCLQKVSYDLREARVLNIPEFLPDGTTKLWAARVGKEEVGKSMQDAVQAAVA